MKFVTVAGIPILILVGVLWLAFLDHDVSLTTKAFGTLLVHPRSAPPPVACKDALAVVAQNQTIIVNGQAQLTALKAAASKFDSDYQHPDWTRYWAEVGHDHSNVNWQRVKESQSELDRWTNILLDSSEHIKAACLV